MKMRSLLVCLVAAALGLGIAFIDTRPHWDDTGISAAALFGAGFVMGFAAPRLAWQVALLIGIWIPAYGIFHGNFGSVIALIFPLLGAVTGRYASIAIWPMSGRTDH